jgi:hypothetical protein
VHDESLLDIAVAWTVLGLVVGIFLLIKLGVLRASSDAISLEPRVMIDWAEGESSE